MQQGRFFIPEAERGEVYEARGPKEEEEEEEEEQEQEQEQEEEEEEEEQEQEEEQEVCLLYTSPSPRD